MPSSGYTAWSVVADEQPTAAKWNILGSNDASFNNGNGLEDNVILTRHIADSNITGAKIASYRGRRQDDTTNSVDTAAILQYGWGAMVFGSTVAVISEAVTFPQAYVNKPIVLISPGGDQGSGTIAYGSGANNVHAQVAAKAGAITNTGFTAWYYHSGSGQYSAGNVVYYQWLAIGV